MVGLPSIDELAQPQAGVVGRAQLLAAGWSSSAIERAVGGGRLVRVARGVYRVGGAPWSRRAAQHAAILLAGDGAVFARWTAAELHGVVESRPGPLHLVTPHRRRVPESGGGALRVTRTRAMPPHERCDVDGLPATSGARTLLDLSAEVPHARLAELVAAAVRVRACGRHELPEVVAAHRNARGRARLRSVLDLLAQDGLAARSDVEIAALQALVDAGLPRPLVAFPVHDTRGNVIAEVDLAYPHARLAVEIDGFRWHSSPERKRRDEARQNRLVLAGWTVLRFSASEVRARPAHLVAAVRQALEDTDRWAPGATDPGSRGGMHPAFTATSVVDEPGTRRPAGH